MRNAITAVETMLSSENARNRVPKLMTGLDKKKMEINSSIQIKAITFMLVPWAGTVIGGTVGAALYDKFVFAGSESSINYIWPTRREKVRKIEHKVR
jgi:glycerol uptake facilitator-like aquaporin